MQSVVQVFAVQVFAVQVFVVEIVVVLNFVAQTFVVSDANGHRRTQIGRKSDDLRTIFGRKMPREVLAPSCAY